jgi:hypothetical protein
MRYRGRQGPGSSADRPRRREAALRLPAVAQEELRDLCVGGQAQPFRQLHYTVQRAVLLH